QRGPGGRRDAIRQCDRSKAGRRRRPGDVILRHPYNPKRAVASLRRPFSLSAARLGRLPMNDDAIPAATLILVREREGAAPELLMVERAGGMAFAAGACVFPGGRIDEADEILGRGHD